MKRTVILLLLALAGTVAAQQAVYSKGLENKRADIDQLRAAYYVGVHDKLDCWIMEGKKHVNQLVMTDQNLHQSKVVPLMGSNGGEVLTATMNDRHASVMVLNHVSRKQTVVLRYTVYLDSLVCGVADTLAVFNHEKKDRCMVWGASSPSGNHSAMVAVLQHSDKQQYSTRIELFDGDMYSEWSKEYALKTMHNMKVTDDGCIVTFGIEPGKEETAFVFNVIDQNRADSYSLAAKCDPIKEINLVTVNGRNAIAAGTFFAPGGKHKTGGVVALSMNIDSAAFAGFTLRPFANEDVNIFLNKDTKKTQRELVVDHVRTLSSTPTDYGAVVLVGRSFRAENVQSNGAAKKSCYASGMHCYAVDNFGNIKWVRNIRRSDMQKDSDEMLQLSLHANRDKALLVKTEHPKMPTTYEIGEAAKDCEAGDKVNIVLYTMDADGEVQKLIVEPKTKHQIFRTLCREDGTLMILTDNNGKLRRLAQLKVTE